LSIQKLSIDNQGGTGIKKTIDEKSMRIVLNMVQTFNYSKPIPSTVRELASNAVDAQREKEIALEILTGKKKVEDYFIEKKGEEFEDSRFDLSYYSPEFLDIDNNDVIITYKENEGMGFVDTFTVRDNGVGISPNRLEGILRLGYSSKRNSKELMGGFGLNFLGQLFCKE
jgi:signal transduction histidine kinase